VRTPAFINPYFCPFVHILEISIKVEDLHKTVNRSMYVGITSPATSQQLRESKLLSGCGFTLQLNQSSSELPLKEVVQSSPSPSHVVLLLLLLAKTLGPVRCCCMLASGYSSRKLITTFLLIF